MKNIFTILFVMIAAVGVAQHTTEIPRSEFVISLAEKNLTVKPGESKQVIVSINRSKSFAKGKIKLASSSVLPEGVTLTFDTNDANVDTATATISVSSAVPVGSYSIIINGTVYNKTKGSILKLSVNNEEVASK